MKEVNLDLLVFAGHACGIWPIIGISLIVINECKYDIT